MLIIVYTDSPPQIMCVFLPAPVLSAAAASSHVPLLDARVSCFYLSSSCVMPSFHVLSDAEIFHQVWSLHGSALTPDASCWMWCVSVLAFGSSRCCVACLAIDTSR